MKCDLKCVSCRDNLPDKARHRERITPTNRGIRELSDFALFMLLVGCSLCVSLSGLVLKDAWPPTASFFDTYFTAVFAI
jgi:hypothetical protein